MEFRYRVGENPVSAPLPHPPKSSIESLQRELQEEKIKEEILATRLNQRRMIEEEIRRELRLQPPPLMVLPPFTAEERFFRQEPPELDASSSGNLEKSIFSDPELVNKKGNSTNLEKSNLSDPELANKKRKSTNVDLRERAKILRAPPAQKEWSCALCMVSATSEVGLKDHLNGKKHKIKAGELGAKKKKKVPEEKEVIINDGETMEKKMERFEINGESYFVVDRRNHFLCETCDVKCYSKKVMISHLSGKKHIQQEFKKKK